MLESLDLPTALASMEPSSLDDLADELRRLLVETVGVTGGHLGPNLGVVEITMALHRVFDSTHDRVLFDTGHQAYVHKMLTGRARELRTLRQAGGLSGYPRRSESPHDLVENSHASTALSYADGMARAVQATHGDEWVVAVVGDGAMTGGMCWEALNNLAAAPDRPVVIVLNDNGRSYAPTVGGLANHLAELRTWWTDEGPGERPRTVFESLGLSYVGPVDGHDRRAVEAALRAAKRQGRTTVIHCVTRKGAGHPPSERDDVDRHHTVRGLDAQGERLPGSSQTWTAAFAEALVAQAQEREDVVAVTAAMPEPTGLGPLSAWRADRVVDVGIAEQHAVVAAAGMAMSGLHPVVAVYSTFIGRAFDQVLMDVGLHELPVTLVLDRSGVTGPDGASHHGMWDLAVLRVVPGMSIAAPRDRARLEAALGEALRRSGPAAIRFPTGQVGDDIPAVDEIGGMDVLRDGGDGPDLTVLAVGALAAPALEAADLAHHVTGRSICVIDPVWAWPLPDALTQIAAASCLVLTVEDGIADGGIGSGLTSALSRSGVDTPVRHAGLPKGYLAHGRRADILAEHGLDVRGLARRMSSLLCEEGMPRTRRAPALDQVGRTVWPVAMGGR